MPGNAARLYDEDFVRWTEEQAAALREAASLATNLPLDWENLAEEIDSLGRSQKRELRSRIATIIEHLLKLQYSPAADPRGGWMETIAHERLNIEDLLDGSPSLRSDIYAMISRELSRTIKLVTRSLRDRGEATGETIARIETANYTDEQILGDWFPGDAPHPGPLPANGERGEQGR
jgi:Domain of unknown function DUF29